MLLLDGNEACGHLSCFWCVHKSMNGWRESHCPICRDPYVHFPSVCQKLYFLLKKIYPLAHKKREEQVLSESLLTFPVQFLCCSMQVSFFRLSLLLIIDLSISCFRGRTRTRLFFSSD